MSFRVEVEFQGLCLFDVEDHDRAQCLLIDGRVGQGGRQSRDKVFQNKCLLSRHEPWLSFEMSQYRGGLADGDLHPDPSAPQRLWRTLIDGEILRLTTPPPPPFAILGETRDWDHQQPDHGEEEWFAWVAKLKDADGDIAGLIQHCRTSDPVAQPLVGRFVLDRGELKSRPVEPNPVFNFRGSPLRQSLAEKIVLSVTNLPYDPDEEAPVEVRLTKDGKERLVRLAPEQDGDTVSIGVRNLPPHGSSYHHDPRGLSHFKWFYEAVRFAGGTPSLELPMPQWPAEEEGKPAASTGVFCPPSTYP